MSSSLVFCILISILFSGFFSGLEIAFLQSDKLRMELDRTQGGVVGKILSMLFKHPDRYITTMLVGNNIVLVLYGLWLAQWIEPWLAQWISSEYIIVLCNSLIATLIIVVFGEYLPKVAYRKNPNRTMSRMAFPLLFVYIILFPVSMLCTFLSRFFLWIMGRKPSNEEGMRRLSTVDLEHYLSVNRSTEGANQEFDTEVKIIQNAIDFSNVQARDCMVPRNEIVACDISTDIERLKEMFVSSGLTKIVVYQQHIDHVVGYIHSAEVFKGADWQRRINTAIFVPESIYGHKLMSMMMKRKKTVAIVIDEMGGTSGLVTLEDLVEEIFGDIEDEHDTNRMIMKKQSEDVYILSGRLEIDSVNERFAIDLPESDDYMTIAGLILDANPHIPEVGDVVEIGRFTFKILRSTETKIELVQLKINSQA